MAILKRPFSWKIYRTLKVDILTLFLSLLAISFALVISFTYFRNYTSILQFSKGTVERVGSAIMEKLKLVAVDAQVSVEVTASFFSEIKTLSIDDKWLTSFLLNAVRFDHNLSNFYIVTEDGKFLGTGNLKLSKQSHFFGEPSKPLPPNAEFWLRFIDGSKPVPTEEWVYKNVDLDTEAQETLKASFDPRERAWYKQAIGTTAVWSDVYPFSTQTDPNVPELGISVLQAVFSEGKRIGVVGVDISFVFLSQFLSEQKIGQTGRAFILNNQGQVLIQGKQFGAEDSSPAVTSDIVANAYLEHAVNHEKEFTFSHNDVEYLAYISHLPTEFGKDWQLAVVVPLSDFFSQLLQTQKQVVIMSLAILLLSGLIILYFSKKISRPIVILSKEINKIQQLDLKSEVRVDSTIKEIHLIDASIAAMRVALESFGRYVPKEIVKQLFKKGEVITLGGEKKDVTIMFSDIEGFSSISEKYPLEVFLPLLNEYFAHLSSVILKSEGTIDKYLGDGIMAFWGAPSEVSDHVVKACTTTLLCRAYVAQFNSRHEQEGKPVFRTRFGVNTGTVIVGNIGTIERLNYTIMGDPVNVASRLQAVDKKYHTEIIISDHVYQKLGDQFLVRPLDIVFIRGKQQKMKIYELIAKKEGDPAILPKPEDLELCSLFKEAYEAFHQGKVQVAKTLFEGIQSKFPSDFPTQLYLERIQAEFMHKEMPPTDIG